ncbi:MAG: ATP-dependent helicase HrpB [Bryobacteraceae bacterium]
MIIAAVIPAILEHVRGGRDVIVEAAPGAGKTTRVPHSLLDVCRGEVWVLEPRRLAARLAARRIASDRGEKVGETVGYQVRFEEVAGPRTRLRFLTEGVLTRKLAGGADLRQVSAVVLDEFHERHLDGDLALALLRRLQQTTRPDLRILIMSATMDTGPVSRYLNDCPVVRSEGRQFELAIEYRPHSPHPLEEEVAAAAEDLLAARTDGDILVFLPGAAEIRRAARACQAIAARAQWTIAPLYGDLSPEEQDRAVLPSARPKLILSTNVAESSITIEGVRAVIDSGLARIAADNPWSGLPALTVSRISKASAAQRAGRAGRTAPGRAIRLYSAEDFHRRAAHEAPEISRRELTQVLLQLAAMGVKPDDMPWFEAPPDAAMAAALELLNRLGAISASGALTSLGAQMAHYPLHPRLARLALEADAGGAGDDGLAVAALLSAGARLPESNAAVSPSDIFVLLEAEWDGNARRLLRQLRQSGPRPRKRAFAEDRDAALLRAVLAAFPDRVARRGKRDDRGDELLLASGGSARLARSSAVRQPEFLVAVEIEERREQGLPLARLASAIEPAWLLDLFPDRVRANAAVEWNRQAERVDAVETLLYDNLAIDEARGCVPPPIEAANLLAARAVEVGAARFADIEEIERYLARVQFAAAYAPLPALTSSDVDDALRGLCAGLRSFTELSSAARAGGLLRALRQKLPPGGAVLLERIAPTRVQLPGGRQPIVQYSAHQPPWIASRLQDFFGLRETPRIATGKVPLVVHLLAPNQRPVQMTTDLAGFWERLYPQVRRELSRRYPRHAWPENPQ